MRLVNSRQLCFNTSRIRFLLFGLCHFLITSFSEMSEKYPPGGPPNIETNNNNVISSDGGFLIPLSDQPATLIHSCYAKVYTMPISPTKKTWQPQTLNPVLVSFYFDKQRNVYRILSYGENEKLIVNSTIVPNMSFLKASPFFGLWSDRQLRTIFGLGFASQPICDLASDWFDKVVKAATHLEENSQNNNRPPLPPFQAQQKTTNWSEPVPDATHKITNYTTNQQISITRTLDPSGRGQNKLEEYTPNSDRVAVALGDAVRQQSVKSLEQDEEKDKKLLGLEQELALEKLNFSQLQETLNKEVKEGEKLFEEVKELREKLRIQINRAETAEELHSEEKRRGDALELEMGQLNAIVAQQMVTISGGTEERRVLEAEGKMLRESLRYNRNNVDDAHKDVEELGVTCRELGNKVGDMIKIQERLKNKLKITNTLT